MVSFIWLDDFLVDNLQIDVSRLLRSKPITISATPIMETRIPITAVFPVFETWSSCVTVANGTRKHSGTSSTHHKKMYADIAKVNFFLNNIKNPTKVQKFMRTKRVTAGNAHRNQYHHVYPRANATSEQSMGLYQHATVVLSWNVGSSINAIAQL